MPHNPRFHQLVADAKTRIREVSVNEAREQQQQGATLIDVREADDFASSHAAGALGLSKGVLELKIEEHVTDVNAPILCYCGGGSRSALAAENLQRMGYQNVASVAGGFRAWQQDGLPVE